MEEEKIAHLQTLSEIRHLMERSSRFISLSGLSGIFAGIYALIGAYAANQYLELNFYAPKNYSYTLSLKNFLYFFVADASLVLVFAIGTGIFLTTRKARRDGNSIFDNTAKKLVINLSIPLISGSILCASMIYHHAFGFIAPSMLIFYGLALINASKYTLNDVRYLGMAEIILGLIASFYIGYGLLFWAIGFGVLHIMYGTYMYYKYEK